MFCLRQRYQFYCLNKTTFHPCLTPKVDETVLTRETVSLRLHMRGAKIFVLQYSH